VLIYSCDEDKCELFTILLQKNFFERVEGVVISLGLRFFPD